MNIVHLLASPFFGGIERQALGLACALPSDVRTTFLSFAERGLARPFLDRARAGGFEAIELKENFPHLGRAIREVAELLRRLDADLLCCSGYKPDLIGWRAARVAGIPVVGIAHGWTSVTPRVRLYEAVDRLVLRWFDGVVCVSRSQADRVRRWGVPARLLHVILNSIDPTPFNSPPPDAREVVRRFFPHPPRLVVGAAGRLSPEKGFDLLIAAAAEIVRRHPDVGFLICGDGPSRPQLAGQIAALGLQEKVVLAGFRGDLERLVPGWDLSVLSSRTEGLPVAVLEALAAGVPVVATAVGGTPEAVADGTDGFLIPRDDVRTLTARISELLADDDRRRAMGRQGWDKIRREWTFAVRACRYQALFEQVLQRRNRGAAVSALPAQR
jgi:glycosyltransferase involved in cell wall biosynthesis